MAPERTSWVTLLPHTPCNARLSSAVDTAHVDNPAVTLTNSDLGAGVAAPGAIVKEPATAVDPTNVAEAAITQQSFSLTTRYAATAVETGADTTPMLILMLV